jgi:hypothetical protein
MIYEFRTYKLKPGSLAEVEKRFGAGWVPQELLAAHRVLAHGNRPLN